MSRYSFVAVCLCMPFGIAVIGSFASTGSCPVRAESLPATAHWAQWRGPSGQGYSDDTRVPLVWSDTNNLLWKTPLPGRGNSSPIMWGDRIFLTAASSNGDERYVLCVRAEDGKLLWKTGLRARGGTGAHPRLERLRIRVLCDRRNPCLRLLRHSGALLLRL